MPLSTSHSQSTPPVHPDVKELLGQALSLALEDDGVGCLAEQARALAETLADTVGWVQSTLLFSEHCLAKGEFENVVELLEPLLGQALAPADRARTLLTLSQTYTQLDEVNHVLRYGLEALSYYQEHPDPVAQSTLHGCLGEALLRFYAFYEALEHHQLQLELLKKQGLSLVNVYNLIGWTHSRLEDFPKALGFLREGVRLARAANDGVGEGKSLGNLSNTYGMMGDYERALDYAQQAMQLFEAQGDDRKTMVVYGCVAYNYFCLGDSERACTYYERALT